MKNGVPPGTTVEKTDRCLARRPVLASLLAVACAREPMPASTSPDSTATVEVRRWPALGEDDEAPFDREIEEAVQQRLHLEEAMDASLVGVDADAGRVQLFGTVSSRQEKQRAVTLAWVDGVVDVDASALAVRPWRTRSPHDGLPTAPPTDPAETEQTEPGEVVFGRE
jgi:hypothetical protein